MALSRVQYQQAVAGNRNYTVTIPYISKDHIKVSVEGTSVTFSWLNDGMVQLTEAPLVGAIVDIARETERVNLLVDFQDASTITESQLDLATRQAFYLAQEAFDLTNSTLAVADDGSYSASNRRISLLGDPNSDDDAVNQGWVKAQFNSGYDAHLERIAAENAEENAHDSEIKASSSEVNAEESADKAKTSEQNAKSSETHSATSEQNSKTSETNAAQSAEEARGYADSVNLPSPVGNAGKVLISDGSDWVLSTVTLDSLIQRIAVLEAKTARQSVSGSITVFNGEVRATDISIGN